MSHPRFDPERALLAEIELNAKKSIELTNELIAATRDAVGAWKQQRWRSSNELCVAMRRLDKLVGCRDC